MRTILFLLTWLYNSPSFAQISGYGVEYSRHLATQLNFNPQRPTEGTFQWDYLKTNGIGLFVQYSILKSLRVETKLKYIEKGFSERVQSLRVPGQFNTLFETKLHNRFQYWNLDANLKYVIYGHPAVKLIPYMGIRNNFLLRDVEKNNIPAI